MSLEDSQKKKSYSNVAPHIKVKTDFERKRALKSQKKTIDAITGFFDKVTFGLSTPKKSKVLKDK
jgi:hypothetical protein